MALANATTADLRQPFSSGLPPIFYDARYQHVGWNALIYTPLIFGSILQYLHPVRGAKLVRRKRRPYSYYALLTHIFTATAIFLRQQVRILNMDPGLYPHAGPVATRLDLFLGISGGLGGWIIARQFNRGNPSIFRTTFQAGAVQAIIFTVVAYVTGEARWHDALVRGYNVFPYSRWFGLIEGQVRMFETIGEAFTTIIFLSGILVSGEGDVPAGCGTGLFLLLIVLVNLVERRISAMITPKNANSNLFLRLMLYIGLVEYKTYGMLKNAEEAKTVEAKEALKAE